MTLLQLVVIVTGFIFLLLAVDLYERRKFNLLHFLVFFGGTGAVVFFIMRPDLLDRFGDFFGIARGADLIVYITIIFLVYLYFELLNKFTKEKIVVSSLLSQIALQQSKTENYYETLQNIQQNGEKEKYLKDYSDPLQSGIVGDTPWKGILSDIPSNEQNFASGSEERKNLANVPVSCTGSKSNFRNFVYCFLIRAYNESSVIEKVIKEIIEAGFSKIVVCDDGSQDETKNIIKKLQKQYPGLILLEHSINRGPGAANKTLFERAKRYGEDFGIEWFVTYDADGQMQIEDMDTFMQIAYSGEYDVLLGSRFIAGGKAHNISLIRRIILWGSKFITLIFNKIYVTDPSNGYKVIHRDALKKIYLESDGFMYASEFLEQIQKQRLKRTEVPVRIIYTDYSKGKGQKSSNAWKILKKLIYRELFYK